MNKILKMCVVLMVLASCKKDPSAVFTGKDAISFYYRSGRETDSMSYSFKFNQIPKSRDTLWIKMRLIGNLSNQRREIKIVAGAGSTAIEGKHFILPPFYLPADSFMIKYPLILLSTPDLDNKAVRLVMQIEDSKDLAVGTRGQADMTTANVFRFKVNFSNQLIKPSYWGDISSYVGEYSATKYQFMIDVVGTSDFRPDYLGGTISGSQLSNIQVKLRNTLKVYTSQHGPLKDENGENVEFPL